MIPRIIVAVVLVTMVGVAAGAASVIFKLEGLATFLGIGAFFLNAVILTTLVRKLK